MIIRFKCPLGIEIGWIDAVIYSNDIDAVIYSLID